MLPGENASLVANDLLGFVVGSGEFAQLAAEPLTKSEVLDMRRAVVFANEGDDSLFDVLAESGYTPYSDPLSHHYPNSTTRLLLVVGTLDPQTVPEWAEHAMETAYTRPQQQLTLVPYAVHAVASLPGLSPVEDGGPDCAFQLAASFYLSGGQTVNRSCLSNLMPPDFAGDAPKTKQLSA